ncbi:MAG TPA: SURF1 family protein [Hyphomonadaceae bacterium]|nr:SURF1 family protein [Hyphomonadaceae bacterium]
MYFRPFPVLTLLAIPAVAALLWLGAWQAGRAQWKAGLIEDYERAAASAPQSVDQAVCAFANGAPQPEDLYRPIDGPDVVGHLEGWPPAGKAIRMFGQDAAGNPGWRHFVLAAPPSCLAEQGSLLVEGPFEPFIPGQPAVTVTSGPAPARFIVAEWPGRPMFAAANSPETNDWHWFDRAGMEQALGVPKINGAFYLSVMPEAMPVHLTRTPPATHIGYSVTWYGMAIALVVIYAIFHARAGRLRFGNRDPAQ